MSQGDIALASQLVPGGAKERREVLRLFARRHCLEEKRVSGPFSKAEAALLKRGEKALALVFESHRSRKGCCSGGRRAPAAGSRAHRAPK